MAAARYRCASWGSAAGIGGAASPRATPPGVQYRRSAVALVNPDFVLLAEAYGIPGFQASTPDEVDSAIAAARAVDGPALVEFVIAAEQNVFPMMPAGKGLSDLLEEQFEEPKQ